MLSGTIRTELTWLASAGRMRTSLWRDRLGSADADSKACSTVLNEEKLIEALPIADARRGFLKA